MIIRIIAILVHVDLVSRSDSRRSPLTRWFKLAVQSPNINRPIIVLDLDVLIIEGTDCSLTFDGGLEPSSDVMEFV